MKLATGGFFQPRCNFCPPLLNSTVRTVAMNQTSKNTHMKSSKLKEFQSINLSDIQVTMQSIVNVKMFLIAIMKSF